jgi:hypothetical protein
MSGTRQTQFYVLFIMLIGAVNPVSASFRSLVTQLEAEDAAHLQHTQAQQYQRLLDAVLNDDQSFRFGGSLYSSCEHGIARKSRGPLSTCLFSYMLHAGGNML